MFQLLGRVFRVGRQGQQRPDQPEGAQESSADQKLLLEVFRYRETLRC